VAGLLADRAGYSSVFLIGAVAAAAGFLVALYLRRAENRASG
jgi:predicted MFS family arabinose efflux permease